jgi:hypothetical protein
MIVGIVIVPVQFFLDGMVPSVHRNGHRKKGAALAQANNNDLHRERDADG